MAILPPVSFEPKTKEEEWEIWQKPLFPTRLTLPPTTPTGVSERVTSRIPPITVQPSRRERRIVGWYKENLGFFVGSTPPYPNMEPIYDDDPRAVQLTRMGREARGETPVERWTRPLIQASESPAGQLIGFAGTLGVGLLSGRAPRLPMITETGVAGAPLTAWEQRALGVVSAGVKAVKGIIPKGLTHFSGKTGLTEISPEFMGSAQSGSERRFLEEYQPYFKRGWFTKRSYHYSPEQTVEPRFGGGIKYEVKEPVRVYSPNLADEKETAQFIRKENQLLAKFRKELGEFFGNLPEQAQEVRYATAKALGYDGYDTGRSIALFKPVSAAQVTAKAATKTFTELSQEITRVHNVAGGSTFNVKEGNLIGRPFWSVSTFPERNQKIKGKYFTSDQIKKYMDKNKDVLYEKDVSVGTWYDKATDMTDFDVVRTIADKDEALQLAKKYDQKAIYNLATEETAYTTQATIPAERLGVGATARRPIWAGIEPPQKPPTEPPIALAAPSEFPSGRKPGGIQRQVPRQYDLREDYNRVVEATMPTKTPLRETLNKLRLSIKEHFIDPNNILFELEQSTGVPTHKLAQVVPGSIAAGEDIVRRRYLSVLKPIQKDFKFLREYMVLKRSQDILARNRAAKLPGNIQGWAGTENALNIIKKDIGETRFTNLERIAKELWELNDQEVLQPMLREGLLSREGYTAIKSANPHYIPFQRADFAEEISVALVRPEASVTNVMSKIDLAGSERKLGDVLQRFLAQPIKARNLIARNKAARGVIEALRVQEKNLGEILVEPVAPAGALRKAANIVGEPPVRIAKAERSSLIETISYFENGEKLTFNVPAGYGRIAKGLDWEQNNLLNKLALITSYPLRVGAVTYNTAFLLINPLRDAVSALFRERHLILTPSYFQGWVAAIRKNALFSEAADANVFMSGIVETMRSRKLESRVPRFGVFQVDNVGDALLVIPRLIEEMNMIAERATRIGTFYKLRVKGIDALSAAVRARDVTVDFSKIGVTMRVINQVVPFSNAALQGVVNTLSTIRRNPKMATVASLPLLAATIYSRVNNMMYETSNQISEWEYTNNWIFQFGEYTKSDKNKGPLYLRIPKGSIGAMITFIAEALFTYNTRDDDRSVVELILDAGREAVRTTLPIELTPTGVMPPILQTGLGVTSGVDPYTRLPIVPGRERTLLPEQQFGIETSKVATALGQQFKVSPRLIDFAIKDYFAGVGAQATWLLDLGLSALGYKPERYGQALEEPPSLAQKLPQIPMVGRFVGTRATRLENLGWDDLNKLTKQTNREFAALPLVNSLGVKLGEVGDNFGQLELTPRERIGHQAIMSQKVLDRVRQTILETNSFSMEERKKAIQLSMTAAKEEARIEFLRTSTFTEPQSGDNTKTARQRADLAKVRALLNDVSSIEDARTKRTIMNYLRYVDPDLDVAMALNGFIDKPRSDKAADLLAKRKKGELVSLGTSYPTQDIMKLRQMIEPYFKYEQLVWNSVPPQVRFIADRINALEAGTLDEQQEAQQLLRKYPSILRLRKRIADYKARLRRSRRLDYYLDLFYS